MKILMGPGSGSASLLEFVNFLNYFQDGDSCGSADSSDALFRLRYNTEDLSEYAAEMIR